MTNHGRPTDAPLDPAALDAALDAWQQGDHAFLTALDTDTSATFGLLHEWATLGDIATPAPHAIPAIRHSRAASSGRPTTPERTPSMSSPTSTLLPPSAVAAPPRWRAIWNVTAWVLIVALAGGAIWWTVPLLREGPTDPTPPLAGLAPSDATPAATTESRDINYGGDAGKSWVVGQADPDVDNAVSFVPLPGDDAGKQWAGLPLIVGDSILAMTFGDSNPQIQRYDLVTNEIVWSHPFALSVSITASDGTLWFGSRQINDNKPSPVAISVETGQMVWTAPTHARAADFAPLTPVVHGQIVYYYDALGDVLALDRMTGELLWQYPDAADAQAVFNSFDESAPAPQSDLVVTSEGIFLLLPSKTILKLNATTGKELESINLIDDFGSDITNVFLQAKEDRLVVQAFRSARGAGTGPERADSAPQTIFIFDTATFDLVSRTALPDAVSNLVVTRDTIYAVGRVSTNAQPQYLSIDMIGDASPEPFGNFNNSLLGPWVNLSLSGNHLMLVSSNGNAYIFNINGDTEDAMGFEPNKEVSPTPTGPIVMWGDRPVLFLVSYPDFGTPEV